MFVEVSETIFTYYINRESRKRSVHTERYYGMVDRMTQKPYDVRTIHSVNEYDPAIAYETTWSDGRITHHLNVDIFNKNIITSLHPNHILTTESKDGFTVWFVEFDKDASDNTCIVRVKKQVHNNKNINVTTKSCPAHNRYGTTYERTLYHVIENIKQYLWGSEEIVTWLNKTYFNNKHVFHYSSLEHGQPFTEQN